ECTPTVTKTSEYFSSNGRSSSSTCKQYTQQNAQKSNMTILPRRSDKLRYSSPMLNQVSPTSSEARMRGAVGYEVIASILPYPAYESSECGTMSSQIS